MGVIIQHKSKESEHLVWHINEAVDVLKKMANSLNYDFSILDTFKSVERQAQWLAVRLLCNKLAPGKLISYKDSGQPTLDGFKISISHSHNLVAISINQLRDTGIDIQMLSDKILRIQDKFLSKSETDWARNNLEMVTAIWSIKEAMYKLYGNASPYFKQDYEVLQTGTGYQCNMTYQNTKVTKDIQLRMYDKFVIALVND